MWGLGYCSVYLSVICIVGKVTAWKYNHVQAFHSEDAYTAGKTKTIKVLSVDSYVLPMSRGSNFINNNSLNNTLIDNIYFNTELVKSPAE